MAVKGFLGTFLRRKKTASRGPVQRIIDMARGTPTEAELEIKRLLEMKTEAALQAEYADDTLDLNELCDVSRLRKKQKHLIRGELPVHTVDYPYQHTHRYQRKIFARFGAVSQVPPGKLWPTIAELDNIQEQNRLRFPMNAVDLLGHVERIKSEEKAAVTAMWARDAEIEANLPKIDKLKEKMYEDASKLEEELIKAEETKNKKIDLVRRYYSYTITVKDPRFKERMTEMIQQEKDKQMKERRAAKKLREEAQKKHREAEL